MSRGIGILEMKVINIVRLYGNIVKLLYCNIVKLYCNIVKLLYGNIVRLLFCNFDRKYFFKNGYFFVKW